MGGLLKDEAIERWGAMRENTVKHFKWTRVTARKSLVWGLIVPLALYEFTALEFNKRAEVAGKGFKFPAFFS